MICPMMSKPVVVPNIDPGIPLVVTVEYVDCQEENCALWCRSRVYFDILDTIGSEVFSCGLIKQPIK